jgi:hypothetical protein
VADKLIEGLAPGKRVAAFPGAGRAA